MWLQVVKALVEEARRQYLDSQREENVRLHRRHVVLLGAGAQRSCTLLHTFARQRCSMLALCILCASCKRELCTLAQRRRLRQSELTHTIARHAPRTSHIAACSSATKHALLAGCHTACRVACASVQGCCLADGSPEELQLAVHRAMRICGMACDSGS